MRSVSKNSWLNSLRRAIVGLAACTIPGLAAAFTFTPTPVEWAMWPEYCRARYAVRNVGKLPAAATYPKTAIQRWQTILGEPTWQPLHHYCACTAYLYRYRTAQTDQLRRRYARAAEDECKYTLDRIPPSSVLYTQISRDFQLTQALKGAMSP